MSFHFRCWLHGNFIWAFIGPVIAILLVRNYIHFYVQNLKGHVIKGRSSKIMICLNIDFVQVNGAILGIVIQKTISAVADHDNVRSVR